MTATETAARSAATRGFGWGNFAAGFVPGLLQFLLGQRVRAAVALASCTLLFFAGWSMVQDRLFFFSLISAEEPRAPGMMSSIVHLMAQLGMLNLPEMLNLPANMLGSLMSYEGGSEAERLWRLPRPMENLGGFLTAASGMLAAFWAADGQFSLRRQRDGKGQESEPSRNPAMMAGFSWLVPGLGHWMLGQRDKGLLVGAAVLLVFGFGLLVSHGHAVDRAIAPVWWIGQLLCGGGTLFAALVTAPIEMTTFPEYLDMGTVLCTVGGLMNLVVMIDAFTIAERTTFPVRASGSVAK